MWCLRLGLEVWSLVIGERFGLTGRDARPTDLRLRSAEVVRRVGTRFVAVVLIDAHVVRGAYKTAFPRRTVGTSC
jgi:hypothetical protein